MPSSFSDGEQKRLETLRAYEVLDTPPDQALDDITALAAHICGAPIALISFVDSDRQWFKSRVGLDVTETAREFSFCAHAIGSPDEAMIVTDAVLDARFKDNPLVTGSPHIRFYCGMPLVSSSGHALGTLCVIDRVSRQLTSEQLAALAALRRGVVTELELRRQATEQKRLATTIRALNEQMETRIADSTQQYVEALSALQVQVIQRERAEAASRVSEEMFRSLWETTMDTVLLVDRQNIIRYANHAVYDTFGYQPEELVGKSIAILQPERMRTAHRDGVARYLATGKKALNWRSTEVAGLRRDGSEFPIEVAFSEFENGGVPMFAGFIRDITARKASLEALRTAELRYRDIFDNATEGIFQTTHEGRVLIVNRTLAQMLGYESPDAMIGSTALPSAQFYADAERRDQFLATMASCGKVTDFESQVRRHNGEIIWVRENARVVTGASGEFLYYEGTVANITERKRADLEVRAARDRLDIALSASRMSLWEWDSKRGTVYLDENWGALLGGKPVESFATIEDLLKLTHPDDIVRTLRAQADCLRGVVTEYTEEHRIRLLNGEWCWIQSRGKALEHDGNGHALRISGANIDISERKRIESAILKHALQQEIVAEFGQLALTEASLDVLMERAAASVARGLGAQFCKVLQHLADDQLLLVRAAVGWDLATMGRTTIDLRAESHAGYCLRELTAVIVEDFSQEARFALSDLNRGKGIQSGVAVLIHSAQQPYGVLTAHMTEPHRYSAEDGNFAQSVATMLAVEIRRRESAQRLAYMAQFDTLTGLPNRSLFKDRLSQAIVRAQREERMAALVFLDLDRFKEINDSFGHDAGDQVLKEVADRLRGCLREGDTVARLGGDEFILVLEDLVDIGQAEFAARKIIHAFSTPARLQATDFYVTPSIGIAVYPIDGSDGESLLKHADIAMYQAKNEGRNNFQFYSATMSSAVSERLNLQSSLRKALERGEFHLFYQPVIELGSGTITSAEALLRWQHPEWGLVAPNRFMNVAEQTGLIVPIGEWVLNETCRQLAQWREAAVPTIKVAVNLSARQFRKADRVGDVVSGALQRHGIAASQLKIEITESLLMENPDASVEMLQKLKAMGIKIALDDFGTGYSSLSYLKKFPIDILKIDQSFVQEVIADASDTAMVRAMIGLAHSLKLTATAEGVETAAQMAFLRDEGCDHAQGYYFSRPIPANEFGAMLSSGTRFD